MTDVRRRAGCALRVTVIVLGAMLVLTAISKVVGVDAQGATDRAAFWTALGGSYGFRMERVRGPVSEALDGELVPRGSWVVWRPFGAPASALRERRDGTWEERTAGMDGWISSTATLADILSEEPHSVATRILRAAREPHYLGPSSERLIEADVPCVAVEPDLPRVDGACTLRYHLTSEHRLLWVEWAYAIPVEGVVARVRLSFIALGRDPETGLLATP